MCVDTVFLIRSFCSCKRFLLSFGLQKDSLWHGVVDVVFSLVTFGRIVSWSIIRECSMGGSCWFLNGFVGFLESSFLSFGRLRFLFSCWFFFCLQSFLCLRFFLCLWFFFCIWFAFESFSTSILSLPSIRSVFTLKLLLQFFLFCLQSSFIPTSVANHPRPPPTSISLNIHRQKASQGQI
jgi:hypothetical protein